MVIFWVAILAVSILLYVLLDGFDLGVGILFGATGDEQRRHAMLSAVAPMWDGYETWLVVAGVILWGAFPPVYATLFSAFYLPLLLMLAGLILRGVAFEYRYKTERMRWIWDAGFAGGSLVAAFMQGMTVGALVEGLPISNGADVVFSVVQELDSAKKAYADLKGRMAKYGRSPEQLSLLPGVMPIIGASEAEAKDKLCPLARACTRVGEGRCLVVEQSLETHCASEKSNDWILRSTGQP